MLIMDTDDVLYQRLHRQHLTQQPYTQVAQVVSSLVAVQSQEYAGAKWALGLRLSNTSEAVIDDAFNQGKILRTHVLRPTWHFVTPKDIRWLLQLTAPNIYAISQNYYRKMELDDKVFAQCNRIIEHQLRDNNYLTREVLKQEFDKIKVFTDSIRLSFIMMNAELQGLICSGPRKSKQFTYALMDERVPATPTLTHNEAWAQLTLRYFANHGPATATDFAKWSGLKTTEAKQGIEIVKNQLAFEKIGKHEFWFTPAAIPQNTTHTNVWLLPTYDEFLIGYKVNDMFFDFDKPDNSFVFDNTVLVNGKIKGNWKRTLTKNSVSFEIKMFAQPNKILQTKIEKAAERYGKFIGLKAEIQFL
jgi:hypothetical protein